MTAADFCLYLEGFLEASAMASPQGISKELASAILAKLKTINIPEVDGPAKPMFPWYPPGQRCPSPPPYNPFPNEMPKRWSKDTFGDFAVGQNNVQE